MSDPSTLAVEAVDLRKTFDRGVVTALDGLTLQIASGEYVALTGPSGCGKSTFMHLLAALDTPDSGTLRVAGEDVTQLEHPNRFRRQRVGLVFQMHNLLPHLDALGNIAIAMIGSDMTLHAQRERWSWSTSPGSGTGGHPSSRAASVSGSHWRGRSPTAPSCCWPTSRPAAWTPSPVDWCWI